MPRDFFQLKGELEAALEQSRPCGHRGEEGGKAVASALARLTELKELTLDLSNNEIGPGRGGAERGASPLCRPR